MTQNGPCVLQAGMVLPPLRSTSARSARFMQLDVQQTFNVVAADWALAGLLPQLLQQHSSRVRIIWSFLGGCLTC